LTKKEKKKKGWMSGLFRDGGKTNKAAPTTSNKQSMWMLFYLVIEFQKI